MIAPPFTDLLRAEPAILVAFSGGGDSTALLHLLCEEVGTARIVAGIVDHAARPGSDEEARLAAGRAEALGVRARILTLQDVQRSQAAWRRARYVALCGLARKIGAQRIAVAHTRDDQAETVSMRARRSKDARLLAGMAPIAPAPVWPEGRGLRLVRPLLDVGRAELRGWLRARGAEWIEDPSNENDAYERVRTRRLLSASEIARLAHEAARLREGAEAIDRAAAAWIAAHVRLDGGRAVFPLAALAPLQDGAARAVSALIAAAAGAESEPPIEKVRALLARGTGTLGGAKVGARGGQATVSRDPGALLGRGKEARAIWIDLPQGKPLVWDGRLEIVAPGPGWRIGPAAAPPDPTAPVFSSGGRRFSLAEAQSEQAAAEWLLAAHLEHLLPLVHPALSRAC
ncbi:MAG: tRNA lysidine(34) synthetase TilS [Hyphomonadaceae bacterium]|nr:tRNA lysidine(34) synthetase TilS [Hyphomonadaceae bacterium]